MALVISILSIVLSGLTIMHRHFLTACISRPPRKCREQTSLWPALGGPEVCRECRSETPHLRTLWWDDMRGVDCRSEATGEIPLREERAKNCPLTEYEERQNGTSAQKRRGGGAE